MWCVERRSGETDDALDAAMPQAGNKLFVAGLSASLSDDVERALIWQFRHSLPYNHQGEFHPPKRDVSVTHRGRPPTFPRDPDTARRPAYVGVDVAFAKGKYLPISVCVRQEGRLTPLPLKGRPVLPRGSGNVAVLDEHIVQQFARGAATFLENVVRDENLEIIRIAIDAPRDYRAEDAARRSADSAMDAEGISCFTTPSRSDFKRIRQKVKAHLQRGGRVSQLPHSNQLWMLVGFALFRELSEIAECIEVFPQAIVRAIGAGEVHKFKREGLDAQVAAAARCTGWSSVDAFDASLNLSGPGLKHDKLDAYLSAWVASLDENERISFGTPPHDVIWVPGSDAAVVSRTQESPRPRRPKRPGRGVHDRLPGISGQAMDPNGLTAKDVSGKNVLCPACQQVFVYWPSGWDTHAAHSCDGLEARTPDTRKREFKTRFKHLFKR